ncbi:MAG: GC-type dockerin domain-anchored protein [Phycisphaerales bacterium JB039]
MLAVATSAASASAQQGGFLLEAAGPVTPANPSTELRVYAWYEPTPGVAEIFLSSRLDLAALDGEFYDPRCAPMPIHCGDTGCEPVVAGGRIENVCVGQFHWPEGGILGDPSTPIHVYTAPWRTTDFTPRVVRVETQNTWVFFVGVMDRSAPTDLYPHGFIPGSGFIVVRDRDCYADCDQSGALDLFDFLCYQNAFAAGEPYADCDASGALDFFDFLCFQNEFAAGCP